MAFLDNIKDRLGIGGGEEEGFDEELYGEDYDAYADNYDEFGSYDDNEYDRTSSSDDSAYGTVTTRTRRERAGSPARRSTTHPQLVSMDDLRNSTRIPDSLNRDPLPARRPNGFSRNSVGHASDYALSGSENDPIPSAGSSRSESSFRSSASRGFDGGAGASAGGEGGYDPYRVYEAGAATSHRPTRSVSVISPVAYNEVENVARMLRAGDAVVLSLRNTPSQLSKRILDFSFGVASALDATVDCIADKVFAITRVSGLDEDELARLRSQGVI